MVKIQIIKKPVISEKSISDAQKAVYTFCVDVMADKKKIKHEVEKMFNVHVVSVKTEITKGKTKRTGRKRILKKEADVKKARVTLKKGEKISLFDVGGAK